MVYSVQLWELSWCQRCHENQLCHQSLQRWQHVDFGFQSTGKISRLWLHLLMACHYVQASHVQERVLRDDITVFLNTSFIHTSFILIQWNVMILLYQLRLCWPWMNGSLLYHCRYNVFICEILLLHTIGVLYWIMYSLGNIWVKHCKHNIKELIMNDKFSFVITPVIPQSHPTVGPIRFLSPVRFLACKAEWSARRNFTSVLFSWSHQATGPIWLDTAVQIWFSGIIRRTPRVPCVMPLQKEINWLPDGYQLEDTLWTMILQKW